MQFKAGEAFLTLDKQGYGTVGGFFTLPDHPGKVFGLTNSHVVAGCGLVNPNGAIIHGGALNSNYPIVGGMTSYYSVVSATRANYHDFALVELNGNIQPTWGFPRPIGYVPQLALARYYSTGVSIHGATSGYRSGIVSAIGYSVSNIVMAQCGIRVAFYDVIVAYNPLGFSAIGDSGSLMCSTVDGRILGVLIGMVPGDNRFSFGFPFWKLLTYLNLHLY